ncbi:MAG: hypothetical protein CME06_08085 [Gemmatimonadetes bacterium]|nr:hypothetical protein [Gemmatimonadota bacterium]
MWGRIAVTFFLVAEVLVFLPQHYSPVHIKSVLFHIGALVVAGALVIRPMRWPASLDRIGLAGALLVLWSALSVVWASDHRIALEATGDLAARATWAAGGAILFAAWGSRVGSRVFDGLLAATVLAAVYGFAQHLGFDIVEYRELPSTPRGTLGNPNFLAGLLVLVLPLAIVRLIELREASRSGADGNLGVFFGVVSVVVLAAALLTSGTTGAILAAGLTALAWAGCYRAGRGLRLVGGVPLVAISAWLLFEIVMALQTAPSELEGLAGRIRAGTTETRLAIWAGSVSAFLSAPVLGVGAGGFPVAFALHRPWDYPLRAVSLNTRHAHDEPLELAVELGVIGLVLAALLVAAAARVAWRAGSDVRSDRDARIGLAAIFGVGGLLLHGLVEVVTRWTVPGALAWLVGGMGLGLMQRSTSREARTSPGASMESLAAAGLFLLIIPAAWGSVRDLRIQADLNRGEQALYSQRLDAARASLERVVEHSPRDLEGLYKLAFVEQEAGRFADALDLYDRIGSISPEFSEIHLNRGVSHLRLGNHVAAMTELEKHHNRSCSDIALFYAARIALSLGDPTRARAHLEELRRLQRIYPAGRMPIGWKPFLRRIEPTHLDALEDALDYAPSIPQGRSLGVRGGSNTGPHLTVPGSGDH